MKKLTSLIVCIICSICALVAQPNHSMNEFSNNDTLRLCQDNPIVIIQKDPEFSGTPYWITENGETHHSDEIIINHDNAGWLLYAEKQPENYKNIYVLFQQLPEEETFHILLEEDEIMVLKATPQEIPGFEYEWWSTVWPNNTVYNGYGLPITGRKPGTYWCIVNDECNSVSIITFIVDKKPSIRYVTTNLQIEKPMIYWETYPNADFDSVGIYRNNTLIGTQDFMIGCFNDENFDGGQQPKKYRVCAWKNGMEYTEPSKEKRPMWLYVSGVSDAGLNYGWWAPLIENGGPIEYFVRYYQLYEVLENGHFGLIWSEIPAGSTQISGIGNLYSKVVLSAVLHDGTEIFSNIVRPNDVQKISENNEAEESFGYIYPNPTNGTLNLPQGISGEYKIFDNIGRLVQAGTIQSQLNVSGLTKGIYTLQILENGKSYNKKFIKE